LKQKDSGMLGSINCRTVAVATAAMIPLDSQFA